MGTTSRARWGAAFGLAALLALSVLPTQHAGARAEDPRPTEGGAIVGGDPAAPGQFPFLVALVSASQGNTRTGQFCGGSVVASGWVLTAGHCVTSGSGTVVSPTLLDVVAGRHDLDCFDFGGSPACTEGERIDVAAIHRHPQYNDNTLNNDIALLQLASPTSAPRIDWAAPSHAPLHAPGITATVMGWGDTESVPAFPDTPQYVGVPIISDADCKSPNTDYQASWIVDATMLCAGDVASGGIDSCQGDSGGPLVVPGGPNGWLQAGVVSWGVGCADPRKPGVYAEVATFADFIRSFVPTVHVARYRFWWQAPKSQFRVRVIVKDFAGAKVKQAHVTGFFRIDGNPQPEQTDGTNAKGVAGFKLVSPPSGSVVDFCVTDVVKVGAVHEIAQDRVNECTRVRTTP